ncbi:MAG: RNA polymerase sigma-70 factor [Mucilaginibacter sp.]
MSNQPFHCDKELFIQIAAGNEYAFRQLFNAYHQQLGAYIFRITGSIELAEEIVQDVFLKIWMNRETLEGVRNFKAYLFIVSKNHALNCLRKLIKERLKKQQLEEYIAETPISDSDNLTPYYSVLDEAIDQLPAQQQKVYLLSRHERLKYSEIAERLDISHETVKKYLQIATASITSYIQANLEATILVIMISIFF